MSLLLNLLLLASGMRATVYGYGEIMCGSTGKPVACKEGAVTSSGMPFNPKLPMVAVPAPSALRFAPMKIGLRVPGGKCVEVWLADKSHPRWIGQRGFDMSPAAVKAITGKTPDRYWSGAVEVCSLLVTPGQ